MSRISWSARAVLLIACAVGPAMADEAAEAAKIRIAAEEFDAGRRAYLQKDFEGAAEHFENADRDAPSMEALRLAIRARKEGGFAARAATLAELALRRYPKDEATVTLARGVIDDARQQLFRIRVHCSPACGLVVDDKATYGDPSTEQIVYLEPGEHSVSASWTEGRGRAIKVKGDKGREQVLSLRPAEMLPPIASGAPSATATATATVPPTPPPPPPSGGLPPYVFYAGLGVTAVLTGVTIWSGIDTKNNPGRDAVEAACVNQGESCPEYQDGLSSQKRTNILLGTTLGVAAVTGVIAAFTSWSGGSGGETESGGRARSGVQPVVGWSGGLQLGATGRF